MNGREHIFTLCSPEISGYDMVFSAFLWFYPRFSTRLAAALTGGEIVLPAEIRNRDGGTTDVTPGPLAERRASLMKVEVNELGVVDG